MINVATRPCCVCGQRAMVTVPLDGYERFVRGHDVQVAFPALDADQRELLISGTHAHCWEAIYGTEE